MTVVVVVVGLSVGEGMSSLESLVIRNSVSCDNLPYLAGSQLRDLSLGFTTDEQSLIGGLLRDALLRCPGLTDVECVPCLGSSLRIYNESASSNLLRTLRFFLLEVYLTIVIR